MKNVSLVLIVLCIILACWTSSARAFVLVQDGVAQVTLVLPANPSKSELAAAGDLQNYIKKMSGAVLPRIKTDAPPEEPAVLIGHSPMVKSFAGFLLSEETLGYDGFIVKRFGKYLVVAGRDTKTSSVS